MRINKTTIIGIFSCMIIIYIIHRRKSSRIINLKEALSLAIYASQSGGNVILENRNNLIIKNKGLTKEGLEDKVTSADYLSHCIMVKTIKHHFPSLNVISEESDTLCSPSDEMEKFIKHDSSNLDYVKEEWVKADDLTIWIDPLDATHEFTEKLYQYVTTMVCIALNGKPIIGVIHKPFENITSWAWVGKSRSADLDTNKKVYGENVKISISRSHSGKIKEILNEKLTNYELIEAAGAGYKSLQVAYKEVDAYLHITAIKKWDICAGNAILDALGGKMTDREQRNIDYSKNSNVINENGLIATLNNHDKFIGLL
ncbi:putative inositol monophosphatase 3 [Coccinella septempunctata]|uniref:putative inositol monophosphatase 3 n=1 Tax=Coccinella septempunctata TaxID=41139 RepID=UPI001D073747|nr:putative inositol monophosphatase 3 [Coccinella septempunctata]